MKDQWKELIISSKGYVLIKSWDGDPVLDSSNWKLADFIGVTISLEDFERLIESISTFSALKRLSNELDLLKRVNG